MKLFVLILSLLSTSTFAAATKLEIPLSGYYFDNNTEVAVNVKKMNKELNDRGLDGLPETVVVGANPEAYWKVLKKRITAANESLGREMHFNVYDDGYGEGYIYKLTICYRGSMPGVTKMLTAMSGNFLNPDQGILAIANGKKKVINDEAFKSREGLKERFQEEYSTNLTNINKWLRYNKLSDTVLVMSDYGPQGDGTELEATTIPPCRD